MAAGRVTEVVIEREHLRRLINGHVINFHSAASIIQVRLDLDRAGPLRKNTDPPQAAEYYRTKQEREGSE